MMKKMIRICCVVMTLIIGGWTTVTPITAFVPTMNTMFYASKSSSSALLLHPAQAAELAACAHECYCLESSKVAQRRRSMHTNNNDRSQALMTNNRSPTMTISNKQQSNPTTRRRSVGPVAWCRRVITGGPVNRRRHG